MATTVPSTNRVLTDAQDAVDAQDVLATLEGESGFLSVGREDVEQTPVPPQLGELLQQVLQAVANGGSVTVSAVPAELTTSAAASMLFVSRPTLMKMIERGEIPAHAVGRHTRLKTDDVVAARRARRERERAAFAALREELDED